MGDYLGRGMTSKKDRDKRQWIWSNYIIYMYENDINLLFCEINIC
jgi:hypothetical protein